MGPWKYLILYLAFASQMRAENLMVITDSLSLGQFGDIMAKDISDQGNNVYSYSVAGSRFEEWLGKRPFQNLYGAAKRIYSNGIKNSVDSKVYEIGHPVGDWSLATLLESNKVDQLVVQLGTNHLKDPFPSTFRKQMLSLFSQHPDLKKITFVMPPRTKSNPAAGKEYQKKFLSDFSQDKRINIIDSLAADQMPSADFVDNLHLKTNSTAEKNWMDHILNHMYPATNHTAKNSSHLAVPQN